MIRKPGVPTLKLAGSLPSFFFFLLSSVLPLEAKVYLDISSPAFRKLPIAVSEFAGPSGNDLSAVIRDDLDYTGVFSCLDRKTFIELPAQVFDRRNWSVIGAEIVVKGTVRMEKNLAVVVSLYDVGEGREIFRKEYQTDHGLLRPLAHTVANDIYQHITGETGIFRTKIAHIVRKGSEDILALMDWDGYRSHELGIRANIMLTPHWSRDGSKLLYSAERSRRWEIYLLDFAKSAERRVFSAKGTNVAGDFFPDSESFVFSSSKDGNPNLYVFRISEAKTSPLTTGRGINITPAVSPDGSRIVFVSDRDGTPQLFIMSREGNDARRITFQGSYNTAPAWSPKGDKIVLSGREGGRNQIFTINADGSGMSQLTSGSNNEDPSFSPDGRYIVFTSDREGERAVYIMRSNGEGQKRITPKGTRSFGPRWSPL